MNGNGFSPENIEITQGDTIKFENKDKDPRWPASNIHPTHEIYSDFDPKKPVASGDSWSFTFPDGGEWKFHDHLKPEFVGNVKVARDSHAPEQKEEKIGFSRMERIRIWFARTYYKLIPGRQERAMKKLDLFAMADSDNPEREEQLRYQLAVFGSRAIVDDLVADSDGGSTVDCHQPAHIIGRVGFDIYGPVVFKDGSALCHSGFYHGAMEGFIKQNGVDNLAADISALCRSFDTAFGDFQCNHGVGHGVLAYESYDLPKALGLCQKLESEHGRSACYGGAFMENIMVAQGWGAIPGHETEWINDDPQFPCNKIMAESAILYDCWQMQTSWMRTLFKEDGTKIIAECQKVPTDYISVCFRSWGRDLASIYYRDVDEITRGCLEVPKVHNYYDQCISGGMNVVVDFWGDKLGDQAAQVCYRVAADHKRTCYSDLTYRLNDIFKDRQEHEKVCRHFEPEYQTICKV